MEEFCLSQLPLQKVPVTLSVTEAAAKYTVKSTKIKRTVEAIEVGTNSILFCVNFSLFISLPFYSSFYKTAC